MYVVAPIIDYLYFQCLPVELYLSALNSIKLNILSMDSKFIIPDYVHIIKTKSIVDKTSRFIPPFEKAYF